MINIVEIAEFETVVSGTAPTRSVEKQQVMYMKLLCMVRAPFSYAQILFMKQLKQEFSLAQQRSHQESFIASKECGTRDYFHYFLLLWEMYMLALQSRLLCALQKGVVWCLHYSKYAGTTYRMWYCFVLPTSSGTGLWKHSVHMLTVPLGPLNGALKLFSFHFSRHDAMY